MKGESKKFSSIRGLASVKLDKGLNVVSVRLEETGKLFEFARRDAPADLFFGDKLWVNLNGKGTVLYSIGPADGTFYMRFDRFGGGKVGDAPKPIYDPGGPKEFGEQKWFAEPSLSMLVVLQITQGPFKGAKSNLFLPYPYVLDEATGYAKYVATPKQLARIEKFHETVGLTAADDIPYSDNVLPELEKLILSRQVEFFGTVESGRVVSVSPLPKGEVKPAPAKAKTSKAKGATTHGHRAAAHR